METPLRHIHSRILPLVLAEKMTDMVEKLAQPIIQSQISGNLNCDIFNNNVFSHNFFQTISIISCI